MKKFLIKKASLALIYIFFAVLFELISFGVMGLGVVPTYWGMNLAFILGFAFILFVIPSTTAEVIILGLILFVQMLISYMNESLVRMSGIVFGFNMLNLGNELVGVLKPYFINWWLLALFVVIYGIALSGAIVINKKVKTQDVKYNKTLVILFLICCIVGENTALLSYRITTRSFKKSAITDVVYYFNDDEYIYNNQPGPLRLKALKKFGYYGFYFMNMSNTVDSLFKNQDTVSNQTYSMLDKYFSDGKMSNDVYGENAYTGALLGKNVVLIVIESGEWYGINKEYTPTLYSMATDGIAFTEYYARDKTNHSEALSVLGSYPTLGTPDSTYKNNDMDFALPSLISTTGYYTNNYFHGNDGNFYNRNVTYGKDGTYGFDHGYFLDTMDKLEGNKDKKNFYDFDKDSEILKNYYQEYTQKDGKQAFFTMHMTLTSHGDYDDLVSYGDYPFVGDPKAESKKETFSKKCEVKGMEKYYELIDSYPETFAYKGVMRDIEETGKDNVYLRFKRYQAGLMDLDELVNTLVYNLKESGELDDTAFFMYADHSAYYNDQNYYVKGIQPGESYNTALYNVPCFMWYGGSMNMNVNAVNTVEGYHDVSFTATKDTASPLVTGTKINKFANSFDLLPTLLHLFGFDYNLNLYQGVSMFSNEESVFVSRESGIFTNDYYFDGITLSKKVGDTWERYDYEGMVENDSFDEGTRNFIAQSANYFVKQDNLEKMFLCNYFAKRNIFTGYNGIKYVRQIKDGEIIGS